MGSSDEPIRVVHVDDEPDFARLTAANLEREDDRFSVRTATTARAALDLIAEGTDCVVSDYAMPDMTGLELFATVEESDPDLPFILFTDTGSETVASEAISAEVSDYLIKDVVDDGYALLANSIVTNVERRRAERRAAETERQLHELADRATDVLWMFSADWSELQFINDAYETVFERPVATVRERPDAFLDAVHPHDRDRVQLAMDRVTEGESARIEYRIETDSGEKWVESDAAAITENGTVARVVGYTRDVTDRKRWEQELERKNDQLERFASMVAHDLRNPWNVADGFLDLARRDHDSDDLATVSSALDRMDRIVTDLLSLARAGATIGTREPVALADLARESWSSVAHEGASLHVDTDLVVSADRNRLAHVFENLFRNSVEHGSTNSRPKADDSVEHGSTDNRRAPRAGDSVEHGSTDSRAKPGDSVEHGSTDNRGESGDDAVTVRVGTLEAGTGFYVEDDGTGIPEDERESVFESGYSTTSTGTGFGLAIVREVVTAHGWAIEATESAGGGARFEITGVDVVDD